MNYIPQCSSRPMKPPKSAYESLPANINSGQCTQEVMMSQAMADHSGYEMLENKANMAVLSANNLILE